MGYKEAVVGFEPTNHGFAIRSLSPLGHTAVAMAGYLPILHMATEQSNIFILWLLANTLSRSICYISRESTNRRINMSVSIGALVLVAITTVQDSQITVLQEMVLELREEVSELKNEKTKNWLTTQRSDEIQNLVQDVLANTDARSSLLGDGVTAGWNNGAFLTSADGNWKLKINAQLQSRWLYNDARGQSSQHGFEQRRTKLKFSGHIIDPTWTFKIVPTWNRDGGNSITEDAWIGKKIDNGSWFKFGQFKQNFLRENIVSSSKQLTVERSMINNGFTYGWSQGVEFGWKNDDIKLLAQYTDGPGQSNTQALGTTTNAWVARAEFHFGEASWNDFSYLTSKAGGKDGFMLGIAYENYERDNGTTFEYGNANGNKNSGWTIDASWRGDGWNVFGYVVNTTATAAGVDQDSSGWLIQGGFLVNDNVELFAQCQEGKVDGQNMDMDVLRFGFNYWPAAGNNNIKWTGDIGWSGKTLVDGAGGGISSADWISSGNGWRADNANEIDQLLIRTQLQLLF